MQQKELEYTLCTDVLKNVKVLNTIHRLHIVLSNTARMIEIEFEKANEDIV